MEKFKEILNVDLNDGMFVLNKEEIKSILKSESDAKKFATKISAILNQKYKGLYQYDSLYGVNDGRMNFLNFAIPCTLRMNKNEQRVGICVGKIEIIINLCYILGIEVNDIIASDNQEMYNNFRREVRKLKSIIKDIKTIKELRQFHIISEEVYQELKSIPQYTITHQIEKMKEQRYQLLTSILIDTKELMKRDDLDITEDIIKYIDIEKLGLWLAGTIIKDLNKYQTKEDLEEYCLDNELTDKEYNNLINYIINYYKYITDDSKYKSNYAKEICLLSLKLSDNNYKNYTIKDFKKDYADFYKNYLFGNENSNKDIVSKMVQTPPKDLFVNWEILPQGNYSTDLTTKTIKMNKNLKTIGNLKTEKQEVNEIRQKLLEEKRIFFSNTNPILKIIGTDKMIGYYGYIYQNGNVIFEKYYKDQNCCVPVLNEAIYVMNINNFMELSRLSKTEIINYIKENDSEVKRIYHSKNWKEKVINAINKKTEVTKENITEMFDKLSTQNNTEGLKELRDTLSPNKSNENNNIKTIKKEYKIQIQ